MINTAVIENKLVAKDDIQKGTFLGVAFVKEDANFSAFGDAKYLSHSRVPNCKLNNNGNKLTIAPLKNINISEALTINFNEYGLDILNTFTKTEMDPPPVNVVFEQQEFKYIPNGYYTGKEITDRLSEEWSPSDEDPMYQLWFTWHEQCIAGNAGFNEELETWWMKNIKEAYNNNDEDKMTKLGWCSGLPISSKNRMNGIKRLRELSEAAIITETVDESNNKLFVLKWKK